MLELRDEAGQSVNNIRVFLTTKFLSQRCARYEYQEYTSTCRKQSTSRKQTTSTSRKQSTSRVLLESKVQTLLTIRKQEYKYSFDTDQTVWDPDNNVSGPFQFPRAVLHNLISPIKSLDQYFLHVIR